MAVRQEQLPSLSHNRPAVQSLRWMISFASFKLFGETFDWLRVHVFQVVNTGQRAAVARLFRNRSDGHSARAKFLPSALTYTST